MPKSNIKSSVKSTSYSVACKLIVAGTMVLVSLSAMAQTAPSSIPGFVCRQTNYSEANKLLANRATEIKLRGFLLHMASEAFADEERHSALGMVIFLGEEGLLYLNEAQQSKYRERGYLPSDQFQVCSLKHAQFISEGLIIRPASSAGFAGNSSLDHLRFNAKQWDGTLGGTNTNIDDWAAVVNKMNQNPAAGGYAAPGTVLPSPLPQCRTDFAVLGEKPTGKKVDGAKANGFIGSGCRTGEIERPLAKTFDWK
jgi:hypothetical protein